jgi:hypothetical protein
MKVGDFPFGDLLKNAWDKTIKNKLLWIYGVFMVSGGVMFDVTQNNRAPMEDLTTATPLSFLIDFFRNIGDLAVNATFFVVMVFLILIFFAVLVLVGLIARAAILEASRRVENKQSYKFWELVLWGWQKMPRLLWLEMILVIVNIVLVVIAFFVWGISGWQNVVIQIIFVVGLLYNLFVTLFRHYAHCYAIFENKTAWQSIMAGIDLLKNNFWVLVVTKLINFGLMVMIAICTVIVGIIILLPIFLMGVILMMGLGQVGVVITMILGVVTGVVFVVVLRGAISTYFVNFLNQVYWRIK